MIEAFDVIVVGAGPAGMAAAVAASNSRGRVCMLDENPSAGGQIWRGFNTENSSTYPEANVLARLHQRLRKSNINARYGVRIVDKIAPRVLRVEADGGSSDLAFEHLILATGARERFLPFPGWTLPGVIGVGGLQAIVKSGLSIAGKRVVISGSGPLLLAVAASLSRYGAHIQGIYEQTPFARVAHFALDLIAHPAKIREGVGYRIAARSAPFHTSSWIVRAHGAGRLRSVTVSVKGALREIQCDYLACGFHLIPNLELPRLLGCAIEGGYVRVDANQRSSIQNVYCAGELTGIGGLDKALCEGEIAGLACIDKSAAAHYARRAGLKHFADRIERGFAIRQELTQLAAPDTFVCRCEDIPRRALEACDSWREAKLYTRCGMGPCQGRVCGPATEALFGWKHETVRPPLSPARLETLAASQGLLQNRRE